MRIVSKFLLVCFVALYAAGCGNEVKVNGNSVSSTASSGARVISGTID